VVQRKCPALSALTLPVDPIDGLAQMISWTMPSWLQETLGGPADLVLSNMAANTVGHQQTDHLGTMAWWKPDSFAQYKAGGAFIAKSLAGGLDMIWSRCSNRLRPSGMPNRPRAQGVSMVCGRPRVQGLTA
jgi:23S rRNA (uridine2552-2'-O)-methyltransferase